tara:strand:- start:5288 stop:6055 length:768 start_codon:yes stop_codon:yes gene_type:complete
MNCIFISVRTDSTRLPNKALLNICNKPSIEYLIENIKKSEEADDIILCTTLLKSDDELCKIAQKNKIKYFRGSSEDKLARWLGACKKFKVDFFVNVDGDDLFFDYKLADLVFKQNANNPADFIDGQGYYNDVYGASFDGLRKVCAIKTSDNTEFIKSYFNSCKDFIKIKKLCNVPEIYFKKDIRMTLDYQEDFVFFETIIKNFLELKLELTFENVLSYVENNQNLKDINWFREVEWKDNQNKMIKSIDSSFLKNE